MKTNETSPASDSVLASSSVIDLSKQEEELIQKYYKNLEAKTLNKNSKIEKNRKLKIYLKI